MEVFTSAESSVQIAVYSEKSRREQPSKIEDRRSFTELLEKSGACLPADSRR